MKVLGFEDAIKQIKPFLPQYLEEHGIDIGKNFRCIRPSHTDSTPSSVIVGAEGDSPRIFCHGCQWTGDIFDACQIIENKPTLGVAWVEDTLKYLAKKYNVAVQTQDLSEEQLYELHTYRAYRAAAALIHPSNATEVTHPEFLAEVQKRGWTLEVLADMGVGTVRSYAEFRASLKQDGFPAAFLDEIDLGRKDIFNEHNMIFTWRDEQGRPVGFTSRNLLFEKQKEEAEKTGEKQIYPKYNNNRTGLKCNIFQKGIRLYGIDRALQATPPLYIFEGQTDVITARRHGLLNCAAIAGSTLRGDHVHLLKELGIFDIILCLDGDETGQAKTREILEKQLAGKRDLKVRVVTLPPEHDPDSFIRDEGIDVFRALACWSAFEWRLNQYTDDDDPTDICKQMIPFVVNEQSHVIREQLCKALTGRTGVSLRAIQQDLELLINAKALQRSRERQTVIDRVLYDLQQAPQDAEVILQCGQATLLEVSRKHDSDKLSNEDFVRDLDQQKESEENVENMDIGYELGPDLKELREALRGAWSRDVFMPFGGKPNHGKTALLSKIAYEIATRNEDVTVIYHSIDDTRNQVIPRFVCIADGQCRLTQNMVRQPRYWQEVAGVEYVMNSRADGYVKIRKLAQEGRLVIKDLDHGGSLPFAENLICYFQDKYPERRIVYILDNIHKLKNFESKDERVRYKTISTACKDMALRRHIAFIGSVEYTKLGPGIKPTNHNIAETGQIEYDANFIAHVYNELGDVPESYNICHQGTDWTGNMIDLPRIELILGKNKITERKCSLFLDFFPSTSDFRYVSIDQVHIDAQKRKTKKKQEVDESLPWAQKE